MLGYIESIAWAALRLTTRREHGHQVAAGGLQREWVYH